LQSESQRLDGIATLVASFAPERIFRLGYAIARKEGKALQSVEDVGIGDNIEVALADGVVNAKVIEKRKTENGTDAKPRAKAACRLCRGAKEEKPTKWD
jgi:exonuclease VII large subunit